MLITYPPRARRERWSSPSRTVVDAAAKIEYPATRNAVVARFAQRYPKVKAPTVRAHVVGLPRTTASDIITGGWQATTLSTRDADVTLCPYDLASEEEPTGHVDADGEAPPLEFALEAFLKEFLASPTRRDCVRGRLSEYRCRLLGLRHFRYGSRFRFV
jgi:hypothetical protein